MLTLGEMLIRIGAAALLGAMVGAERDLVGKEAGIRTNVLVAVGAALFTIISIIVPYIIAIEVLGEKHIADIIAGGGPLRIVSNVVVGIGFLGGGLLFRHGLHVRGVTTAASVWFIAAIGILAGIGEITFAVITTLSIVFLLVVLRKINVYKILGKKIPPKFFNEKQEKL